jgi:O-antigen ligase
MKIYGFWTPANLMTTPFGPFVNKNHFAGWMLMGLPLAMGLGLGWAERGARHRGPGWRDAVRWISSEEGGKVQLAAIALAVMAIALLMTRSRSGVGGFVLAMMLAAVVVGRRASGLVRWGALGALALLVVGIFASAGSDATERFTTGAGSIELRKRIWRDSVSVVRDFPLAGTGLNTFGTAMLTYQTSQRESHFQEAHNDYLQVLVEGGLLLAIPVAAALALLVLGIRRRFADGRDDAMTHWIRVGATTALVAIGAQSLVEFSLQMPGNAALCVVVMALALHQPAARTSTRRPPPAAS